MKNSQPQSTKKAIIVGATSGIGKALALQLVKANYKVGITGRRNELLQELKSLHPDHFTERCFDVTDLHNASALVELTADLGGLDLIIVSSGTGKINESLDFELEKPAITTNVLGYTEIIDWAYNYFKTQKRPGHIVGISSVAGLRGNRFAPAYNASKAYQITYLESIRHKAVHDMLPIIITDIRPGFVDTAMGQAKERFWLSTPEKAAAQIYRAICKKKGVAYITRKWALIALLMKYTPGWVIRKL